MTNCTSLLRTILFLLALISQVKLVAGSEGENPKNASNLIETVIEISNKGKNRTIEEYVNLNDSILSILKKHLEDNNSKQSKISTQEAIVEIYKNNGSFFKSKSMFDESIYYYEIADSICQTYLFKKKQAGIYIEVGVIYGMQSKFDQSTEYTSKALALYQELDELSGIADAQNNLGVINFYKGDYTSAQSFWNDALYSKEILHDSSGIANTLLNIGNIQKIQKEYEKAIFNYENAKKYYVKIGNLRGICVSNNNIGGIKESLGLYKEALENFTESVDAAQKMNDNFELSSALGATGGCYQNLGLTNQAIDQLNLCIDLCKISGNNKQMTSAHLDLAKCYENMDPEKSISNALIALDFSKQFHLLPKQKDIYEFLWKFHKNQDDNIASLKSLEKYISIKDSLESIDQKSEISRLQFQFEFDKKIAEDSIKNANFNKIKDAEIAAEKAKNQNYIVEAQKQDQLKYFLICLLVISSIFGILIYQRLKLIGRQKVIIEKQKAQAVKSFNHLEERNKEILDSIIYAKRIQNAILPPISDFKKHLTDSFIYYQPKDVVAGDFYWFEKIGNKIFFAACDCTGHGVPGAMVSVICKNALTRCVREFGLITPAAILDKAKEIIIEEFVKSDEEVKDGMDISLCMLENNTLCYSGANNPLWLIRSGSNTVEVVKGDKQPVGMFVGNNPFTENSLELFEGDSIYIFTDGLIDQFGGEKGKKYKSSKFKEFLISIKTMTMENQKNAIKSSFEAWKGEIEQVDDVCVIGYKFE